MKTRYIVMSLLLIAAALAATAFYWPALPQRVPMHWRYDGQIDGYGPRLSLLLLGPGAMALVLAVGVALPRMAPRRLDIREFASTYYYMILVIVVVFGFIYTLALVSILAGGVTMHRAAQFAMCMVLILMGNPMGKIRRNSFMGVRTPWTKASDRVWYATHRLAAKLMVGGGLLGLVAIWAAAPGWMVMFLYLAPPTAAAVYSLVYYKRLQRNGQLESQ